MDRRLVEDDDRRRLGDRHGEQDELALAERQLAGVATDEPAEADPLDRGGDGGPIGRARAADRVLVGQPAEGDDLLDPGRERQARDLRDDRDPAGDLVPVELASGAPSSEDLARATARAGRSARGAGVDLPAPFGPTSARRSPGPTDEVDVAERRRRGRSRPRRRGARGPGGERRSQLVAALRPAQQEQEERRADDAP